LLNGVPVSSQFSKPLVEGRRTSIFNSPVLANIAQEIGWGYLLGIKAAHVIAKIGVG
jgi:hypothetical protein